jgi:broad specificity phosphatase PhoE
MAKIYLCRHGQDEDNAEMKLNGHRDRPLTDLGRTQAADAGRTIRDKIPDLDAVLSSPLQRARHTAEAIANSYDVSVRVLDSLIERDFGVLTGRSLREIDRFAGETLKTEKVNYFLTAEGAETFDDLMARARRVVDHVDRVYAGKTVLLVCHGDIGKMIMAVKRGVHWSDSLKAPFISNTEVIEL